MKKSILGILVSLLLVGCAQLGAMNTFGNNRAERSDDLQTEPARNPLDFRRTSLIVKDMEASLALYRDSLGMTVVYDQELSSPGLSKRYKADGVNRSRLVLMQANDSFIGMIGLWQFLDQTERDKAMHDGVDFTPGEIIMVFNTTELAETFALAEAAPGVKVISEPKERHYPSEAGDIKVMVSMLSDNDGHILELNQMLYDPRNQ